jgi:hypothetical protein
MQDVDTQPIGDVGAFINRREQVYGEAVNCWSRIAEVWSGILGVHVNPADAVLCMMGMKLVRTQIAPDYSDNNEDIEGYRDIFLKIIGDDMIFARSVTDYIEQKWPSTGTANAG